MNRIVFVLVFFIGCGGFLCAQNSTWNDPNYQVPKNPFLKKHHKRSFIFNAKDSPNASVRNFGSFIHYEAFFCKMEVKTMRKTGIWLKVHAGDYDRYAKGY